MTSEDEGLEDVPDLAARPTESVEQVREKLLAGGYAGKVLIVQHCPVSGLLERPARWVRVGPPEPYAQYATSVRVSFIEPRKRKEAYYRFYDREGEGASRFCTIDVDGRRVWDSRDVMPVDMAKWEECRARFKAEHERARAMFGPGVTVI
jgi:hypothetical protein